MFRPDRNTPIIAGGYWRLRVAAYRAIRTEVEREQEERLRAASSRWRRWLVRISFEPEVRRRLARIAPSNGLY